MRSKYINTFDTTSEFENYIESSSAGFPNVAYTKDTGDVHYTSTSPNDHLIYGTLTDPTQPPVFRFNDSSSQTVTAHVDPLNNAFYIDESDMSNVTTPITSLNGFIKNNTNITSITKLNIDTSNVTSMGSMFYGCVNLSLVNMSALDTSNVTDISTMFRMSGTPKLRTLDLSNCDLSNVSNQSDAFKTIGIWYIITNVYITEEGTLMKLTNNLTAANYNYIPEHAIIYYNDQVYKWQNNAWTLQ